MAEQAPISFDYVKLVRQGLNSGPERGYRLVGPKDVLEPIFADDVKNDDKKGISMEYKGSNRHLCSSDAPSPLSSEIVVSNKPGYNGLWTWSAWVQILTSNGFTCVSVGNGCGGSGGIIHNSEIWLFQRQKTPIRAMPSKPVESTDKTAKSYE